MAITKADLRKQLHAMGVKTYRNKKTKEGFVKKEDIKKILSKIVKADENNPPWEKTPSKTNPNDIWIVEVQDVSYGPYTGKDAKEISKYLNDNNINLASATPLKYFEG